MMYTVMICAYWPYRWVTKVVMVVFKNTQVAIKGYNNGHAEKKGKKDILSDI